MAEKDTNYFLGSTYYVVPDVDGLVNILDDEENPIILHSAQYKERPDEVMLKATSIQAKIQKWMDEEGWDNDAYSNYAYLNDKGDITVTLSDRYDDDMGFYKTTFSSLYHPKHTKLKCYKTDLSMLTLLEKNIDSENAHYMRKHQVDELIQEEDDYRYMVAIESRNW